MMPKVSVIVPVYNLEKYIGITIDSILKQTLSDWELILVNDASTDNSLAILKDYEKEDNRIKIISYSDNKGPMYAREEGCKISCGDYVTFCDGDDELSENALELLYNAAVNMQADIVVGQLMTVYPDGKKEPFNIRAELNYGNSREAFFKSVLRREIQQGVAAKLFHRDIVRETNHIIIEHCLMSEDATMLFQYINRCHRVFVIPDYIYFYYQRSDSSTHKPLSLFQIEIICVTSQIRLRIVENYPETKDDMITYFAENLISLLVFCSYREYRRLLHKYGLDYLISTNTIIKYFKPMKALNLLAKRELYPYIYNKNR